MRMELATPEGDLVTTDVYNQVFASNTSSQTVTSTVAAYPDLKVTGLGVSPSSGLQSGDSLTVVWSDSNSGKATVSVRVGRPALSSMSPSRAMISPGIMGSARAR